MPNGPAAPRPGDEGTTEDASPGPSPSSDATQRLLADGGEAKRVDGGSPPIPMEDGELAKLQSAGGPLQKRQIFAFMGFLGLANVYAMRINLSEAAESMQDRFNWSNHEQGYVLSAFFWGYVCFQIPGALLAERYGGKYVFGIGILCTAVLTLLLPLFAHRLWAIYLLRALMGLAEGVTFPALNHVFTKWVPSTERAWLVAFVYAGPYLGNAVALPVSGALIGIHKDDNDISTTWPWCFYVFGIVGCIWFPFWMWLIENTPEEHDNISDGELRYIQALRKNDAERDVSKRVTVVKSEKPPWFAMLTHPAAWTLYLNHFASNYCVYTVMTYLPKYLKEDLDYDLKKAGFIACLPFLLQCIFSITAGRLSEKFANHMPIRHVRLIMELTSFIGAGGLLVVAGFITDDRTWAVVVVTIATGFTGVSSAGYNPNFMDISPYYAGRLYGISNTVSNIAGIIAPIVCADLLGDTSADRLAPGDPGDVPGALAPTVPGNDRWRTVFVVTAAVYCGAGILWIIGMRAKPVQALN